jgi:hypothetical protein
MAFLFVSHLAGRGGVGWSWIVLLIAKHHRKAKKANK